MKWYRYILVVLVASTVCAPLVSMAATQCAAYENTSGGGLGGIDWGTTGTKQKIAQCFTVAASCTVGSVAMSAEKVATPVDSPTFSLYSSSGGNPLTLLETGSTPTLTSSYTWATSTFAGTTTLSPGTTYCVVLDRTGSLSDTNYYQNQANNNAASSDAKKWNGSSWGTASSGYGLLYRVYSVDAVPAVTYYASTSTVDQVQTNLFYGVVVFFASFFGMIWLLRKH